MNVSYSRCWLCCIFAKAEKIIYTGLVKAHHLTLFNCGPINRKEENYNVCVQRGQQNCETFNITKQKKFYPISRKEKFHSPSEFLEESPAHKRKRRKSPNCNSTKQQVSPFCSDFRDEKKNGDKIDGRSKEPKPCSDFDLRLENGRRREGRHKKGFRI